MRSCSRRLTAWTLSRGPNAGRSTTSSRRCSNERNGRRRLGRRGSRFEAERLRPSLEARKSSRSSEKIRLCPGAARATSWPAQWFDQVMLVKRLREIRALDGFSRVLPIEGPDDERIAELFDEDPGWLPAIEVKGEGVFLRVHPDLLEDWSVRPVVAERVGLLAAAQKRVSERGGWPVVELPPKKVVLHTLAHVLIDQFSLEAGYPTASLRERLYVDQDQAGILIYTATTDSAGSLGGLIAQAQTARLESALLAALGRASWCSADPVCMESDGQGVDGLNLAACHACALLPETSCEMFNVLLDRGLLVGTPDSPELGLLAGLVSS